MALGDAYIDVHANTAPFRTDLEKMAAGALGGDNAFDNVGRVLGAALMDGLERETNRRAPAAGRSLSTRVSQAILNEAVALGEGFVELFSKGLRSPVSIAVLGTVGAILAPYFLSAFAAAISLGAGAGIIGLGAYLLRDEPRVKAAGTTLGNTLKDAFTEAAKGMIDPLVGTLNYFTAQVIALKPQLADLFKSSGALIDNLGVGLAGFIREMLPGLQAMLDQSGPIFDVFAKQFPEIGKALGDLFKAIGDNAPVLAVLFSAVLSFVTALIKALALTLDFIAFVFGGQAQGIIRGFLTDTQNMVRAGFQKVVDIIWGIFGNAGSLLYNAGASLVQGLINGIVSKVNYLKSWISYLANLIASYLPGSPAKVGPLSGQGYTYLRGQRMVSDLAAGMKEEASSLAVASNEFATSITTGQTVLNFNGPVDEAAGRSAGSAAGRSILGMIMANQSQLAVRVV